MSGGGSSTAVLITGVRLYGEGDPVDVLVADGQIAGIGADLAAPADAEVIDATGQVLRNGLGLLGVSAPERM